MDSTDLQPGEPRRRTSSAALLAAGSLTGLVLGFGGMAFAAETPATPDTGSSSSQQTATADEDAAPSQEAPDGAAADELCDEPGGRAGAEDSTADDSTADDSTADDSTADATGSTTSAAA